MKIMISFFSVVIGFIGFIPFLGENFPIPNQGTGYTIVLLVLGILVLTLSIINRLLMGIERSVIILQALAVLGMAALRFIPSLLPALPRDGVMFSVIIIIIGGLGLIYGLVGMG
jgi:hypothetical protein